MKHEFFRKPIYVSFDSLVENFCLDFIQLCQIPIEHNSLVSRILDLAGNQSFRDGNRFTLFHILVIVLGRLSLVDKVIEISKL